MEGTLRDFLCIPTGQLNPLFHTFTEFRRIVNRVVVLQSTDWLAANAQFSPALCKQIQPNGQGKLQTKLLLRILHQLQIFPGPRLFKHSTNNLQLIAKDANSQEAKCLLQARWPGVDNRNIVFTTEVFIIPEELPFPPCEGTECQGTLV